MRITDLPTIDRNHIRSFCAETVRPNAIAWDRQEMFDSLALQALAKLGLFGCLVPLEYSGAACNNADYCWIIEELAAADPSLALLVAAHCSLCTNHILLFGTPEQKATYLPLLASGKWLGSWSITESNAGSDAGALQTKATKTVEGWKIEGNKRFTTNAADARLNVVLATTDGAKTGISAFLVHSDNPGRTVGERIHTLGMKASQTHEVSFRDCIVGHEGLIGAEGRGLADALKVLDGGRLSIAALSLGVARGAYDEAFSYSKRRQQFGKRLIEVAAIRELMVDMEIAIEGGRALLEKATSLADSGQPFGRAAALAKLVCSEAAIRVANLSLQVHGGNGYVAGTRPEKFYRDARLCTIGEGTTEILRHILARKLDETEQQPSGGIRT